MSKTWKDIFDTLRSVIALHFLDTAINVAPESERKAYIAGAADICHQLMRQDFTVTDEYYARRFWAICLELHLDPKKVLSEDSNRAVVSIAAAFNKKEIDEVDLMRCLSNLSIMNDGAWKLNNGH
jgi:hypothetical protein